MKKKAGLIQMYSLPGEVSRNEEKALSMMKEAVSKGADMVALPALWNTGIEQEAQMHREADAGGSRTVQMMGDFAVQNHVSVAAGAVIVSENGKFYQRAYAFNRQGDTVGQYDQMNEFFPLGEADFIAAGSNISSFMLEGFRCACVIGGDLTCAGLLRMANNKGIDLFFAAAQWTGENAFDWSALLRARAIENGAYAVGVNGCGAPGGKESGGESAVITPRGITEGRLLHEEGILVEEIDSHAFMSMRTSF